MKLILILYCCYHFSTYKQVKNQMCSIGTFPCGNVSICLKQEFHCDGTQDCPNGEDEENCADFYGGIEVILNSTEKRPEKAKSNISEELPDRCEMVLSDSSASQDNYDNCTCVNRTRFFCSMFGLTHVPTFISGNLSRLILTGNKITSVPQDAFQNHTAIEIIHLSWNQITEIVPYTFSGLRNLRNLFLSHNKLKSLSVETFAGLDNVKWIALQNNALEDFNLRIFSNTPMLRWLDIGENHLTLNKSEFPPLPSLKLLGLDGNRIENISQTLFYNLTGLGILHLKDNRIKFVDRRAFTRLDRLVELDLSNNLIEYLNEETFVNQKSLRKLSLNDNPIAYIPNDLFRSLTSLQSFELREINIDNISTSMFSHMTHLNFIYFKKFHYCSYAPHVRVCKPNTDGVSSTEHLLVKPVLRYCVWVVATFTCFGNAMVLLGRYASREDNKILSIFIKNLSAADFLMGIYLFVIGAHDFAFREQYNRFANMWMSSWTCTITGILAMTSSETSVLIMCFMSVERFVCIVCPFSSFRLTGKSALLSMATIWGLGFLLAFIPVLHWQGSNAFYGSNGMCFPLHIDDPFVQGWEYSAFLFLGVNFLSVLLIGAVYLGMFVSIQQTRKATTLMVKEKKFAIRFFFIVFTDCLCWIPIIIMKFIAIDNIPITADLYAWVVVLILPINSAINPLLYTFTTTKFLTAAKKFISSFLVVISALTLPKKDLSTIDTSVTSNPCSSCKSDLIVFKSADCHSELIPSSFQCPSYTESTNDGSFRSETENKVNHNTLNEMAEHTQSLLCESNL